MDSKISALGRILPMQIGTFDYEKLFQIKVDIGGRTYEIISEKRVNFDGFVTKDLCIKGRTTQLI